MRCKRYEMRKKACVHLTSTSHWTTRDVSGTSLPRYYSYYPHLEAARERHIFVPKHFPNENPSSYDHKGLKYFQDVSSPRRLSSERNIHFSMRLFSSPHIPIATPCAAWTRYRRLTMSLFQNRTRRTTFIVVINRKCPSKWRWAMGSNACICLCRSDMMVLRDEQMYKTPYSKDFMTRNHSFVSSTTVAPRGC